MERCIALAKEAIKNGDEPLGSILVSETGKILFEGYNHVGNGDQTQHPEFAIARWAAKNMTPEERLKATVYTATEHCPIGMIIFYP